MQIPHVRFQNHLWEFYIYKDEESKQYINGELAQVFARLSTNNDDFFVFAANKEYQEDWYNAKYLHENLKRYFPELKSELVSLSDLEIFDDGVYFSGKNRYSLSFAPCRNAYGRCI